MSFRLDIHFAILNIPLFLTEVSTVENNLYGVMVKLLLTRRMYLVKEATLLVVLPYFLFLCIFYITVQL